MKYSKGQSGNPKGKPRGAENKVTKQARELVLAAIDEQSAHFNQTMDRLRKQNLVEWSKIMVKLMDFVLPKKFDIDLDAKIEPRTVSDVKFTLKTPGNK